MATEAKTKVEATVNAKVVSAIKAQLEAQTIATSKKVITAQTVVSEAKRCGYDKEQARKMLVLSWREARGFHSKDEKEIALFDLSARPDVSKVMSLAYPDDTTVIAGKTAAQHLAAAIKHNEKNPAKATRIGENRLLEIARGNQSFEDAVAGKAITRAPRGKQAAVEKLPPADQVGTAIAGLYQKFCQSKDGNPALMTYAKFRSAVEAQFERIEAAFSPAAKKAA